MLSAPTSSRAALAAALTLAFTGCGGGDDDGAPGPATVDAAGGGAIDAAPPPPPAPACATIASLPSPPTLTLEGKYLLVHAEVDGLSPVCFSRAGGNAAASYSELVGGVLRRYTRLYMPAARCLDAAFDTGGDAELFERGTVHPCGPSYQTAAGTVQQVLWKRILDDGSTEPVFVFLGTGPGTSRYVELLMGNQFTTAPSDSLPPDFLRSRRPR